MIKGSQLDYYIAETVVEGEAEWEAKEGEETEQEPNIEEKGTGVNKYTYFVTNDVVSSKWTQLPDLKPSQIKASRSVKVQFSGDLERKIYSNPFFFG